MKTNQLDESSLIRRKVDSAANASTIIEAWKDAIKSVPGFESVEPKIGIAMPGPFDYSKGISLIKEQGKYASIYKLCVKDLLAKALGISPENIHFENDAACFLQGEVEAGAARSAESAIGLTLGTGLGSSKYQGGFAEDAALWCSPFKASIVEEYVSTRWFVNSYLEKTGENIKEVRELTQNLQNEVVAKEIFREFGNNLALFLKEFIKKVQPEVIVLGGNISKAKDLFLRNVVNELASYGLSTPIKITELGEQAALIGAACSWKNNKKALL